MQEAHLLSPRQAAAQLEISTRTLRRWSTAFGSALGSAARRKGKRRGYTSQDIQTLRLAQQELAQGRTLKQIAPGLPVVDASAPSTALVLSPEANLSLGQALERTSALSVSVTDHDERLADLEAFFRLPWYRRLFGSPTQK